MTDCVVQSGSWRRAIDVPPSKSVAHRLMICAALSGMSLKSIQLPEQCSEDLAATAECLAELTDSESPVLDCRESGSTLRFLLPVAAALGKNSTFIGRGRLPQRPIGTLLEELAAHGVRATSPQLPLALSGRLSGGIFSLPGDLSSQFVTGLLFALPLLREGGSIRLSTPLQSRDYVNLTIDAMARFGVQVQESEDGFRVEADASYRPLPSSALPLIVEGDWSNAAFPLVAGAIGGEGLEVRGLRPDSRQGDRRILELLSAFGARVSFDGDACRVYPGMLRALPEIDVSGIPDLVPVLAVLAGCAEGTTRFVNAARLRLKESDRLASTQAMLAALGGRADAMPDALVVHGVGRYHGGVVDSCNDHRIVMAAAVAAEASEKPITILGANACAKSWPAFFEDCLENLNP